MVNTPWFPNPLRLPGTDPAEAEAEGEEGEAVRPDRNRPVYSTRRMGLETFYAREVRVGPDTDCGRRALLGDWLGEIDTQHRRAHSSAQADGTHQFSGARRAEIQRAMLEVLHVHDLTASVVVRRHYSPPRGLRGVMPSDYLNATFLIWQVRVMHESEIPPRLSAAPRFNHEEDVTVVKWRAQPGDPPHSDILGEVWGEHQRVTSAF